MADMISMEQADERFGKKGVAQTGLGLGIAGTALALLNGGLGGIFGGNTTSSCTNADSNGCAFVNKDTFWRQNVELEKELGQQKYDALDANYKLYITLDNKINALAVKDAQLEATLPLAFQLAQVNADRYTDGKISCVDKQMALGFANVASQLSHKVDGDLKLPWTSIYSGIPTMPTCALDVTCGGTAS